MTHEYSLGLGAERWDLTTCGNCGDVVHKGAMDDNDLCPDCAEFNAEGLL